LKGRARFNIPLPCTYHEPVVPTEPPTVVTGPNEGGQQPSTGTVDPDPDYAGNYEPPDDDAKVQSRIKQMTQEHEKHSGQNRGGFDPAAAGSSSSDYVDGGDMKVQTRKKKKN